MSTTLANPFSVASFTAAFLSLLLASSALTSRWTPGSGPFAALTAGIAVWTGSYGFRVATTDPGTAAVWMGVEWVGILVATTAWPRFALEHTGAGMPAGSRVRFGLLVPAAVILAGIWSNGVHGLFGALDGPGAVVGGIAADGVAHGPLYWLAVAYVNALLLAGTVVLVRSVVATRSSRRRNVILLLAVAIPWGATALDAAGYGPVAGLNLAPFALTVTCLLLGWLLFADDLLAALPLTPAVSRSIVFSELADGVVVLDADDRVVECNPAARRLLPGERSIRGEPIAEAFPALAAVLAESRGSTAGRTVVLDGPDGNRYFEVRSSPIERGGSDPAGHLLTLHDIDDRILREQRLDVLNRILRHNVRNQMTVILGHNANLLEVLADDGLGEQAETVDRAGTRLLDWAERAGQVERTVGGSSERIRMDLVAHVEAVAARRDGADPYATIFTYLPESAPVVADRSIGEAIDELVANAIEHSDRPRPTVRITVEPRGETVELRVEDDGPGIPADERRALARGRETPLEHASGLGLWLVSWLVRLSGGTIDFEENDPRGSLVRIRLPAPPSDTGGSGET